jgi:hypothetical protein
MYRRALVVLIFAAVAAVLLRMFPGPLFSAAPRPDLDLSLMSGIINLDPDNPQTIELRTTAKSAMNALVTMRSQKATDAGK